MHLAARNTLTRPDLLHPSYVQITPTHLFVKCNTEQTCHTYSVHSSPHQDKTQRRYGKCTCGYCFLCFSCCPPLQRDYKPVNLCFTDLSMTYCVRVEGQGMLLGFSLIYPVLFASPPSERCQSLNILRVCRDVHVIRVSLSWGRPTCHKQPLPRLLKYTRCVYSTRQRSNAGVLTFDKEKASITLTPMLCI